MIFSIYILFIFSSVTFFYFNLKKASFGSDHFVHKVIINSIKENGNKYFDSIKPWLFGNFRGYPMLYHYILAFFPLYKVEKFHERYSNIIYNSLSIFLAIFLFSIVSKHQPIEIDIIHFILLISLVVSSTSLFDPMNARMTGISARSIGLILGQLMVLLLIQIFLSKHCIDTLILCGISIIIAIIIYLSSQFTTQFIVLLLSITSIINWNILPLSILIISFLLYALIFRSESKHFISYQIKHKKGFIFFNPFKNNIIRSWKYFVRNFWGDLWWNKSKLPLFFIKNQNPLIKVLIGLPSITLFAYLIIFEDNHSDFTNQQISKIILTTIIIFFLTSIGKFKILGEAERYFDFVVPLIATYVTLNYYQLPNTILITAIFLSLIILFFKVYYSLTSEKSNVQIVANYEEIKLALSSQNDIKFMNIRLASNNFEIAKKLINISYKVFYGWLFGLYKYNPYNFFKQTDWPTLKDEYFYYFIIKYQINFVVIDEKRLSGELSHPKIKFDFLKRTGDLSLYKSTVKS